MITPQEILDYTSFQTVKNRATAQLEWDITQAEQDIFQFVGHKFTDDEYEDANGNTVLPKEVKLAFIKLSEYYALVNNDESFAKGIKSEKLGDYSYQLQDGQVQKFSLDTLLSNHVQATGDKGTKLRLRSF